MLPPSQNRNKREQPKINIGDDFQAKIPSRMVEEQKFSGEEVVRPSILNMGGTAFEKYA